VQHILPAFGYSDKFTGWCELIIACIVLTPQASQSDHPPGRYIRRHSPPPPSRTRHIRLAPPARSPTARSAGMDTDPRLGLFRRAISPAGPSEQRGAVAQDEFEGKRVLRDEQRGARDDV
jgi:hypothetical protein